MKLSLIRPSMGGARATDAMPPLALGILAARSPDWEVSLFDEKVEQIPKDDSPDLAAFSVETFTARRAYALADDYRQRGVPVVMGGYHPSFLPEEALRHADAVVVGDAEGVWEKLLEDFSHGRLQRLYRGDPKRTLADYRIDRSIFQHKPYAPIELIQYGRGCRFACDFCSIHSFYGQEVRVRPLPQLRDELTLLSQKRLLFFVDDNLFASRRQLTAMLEMLTPMKLRWACQISIDVARDKALLDHMAAAGCRYALIGFESLDAGNLKQMGKPWNRVSGSYAEVIGQMHQRGIGVYGTFVFGYDADSVDTIRRSVEFAIESRLEIANFNPLTPTPGSALYDRLLLEQRLLKPGWWTDENYRYGDPIFTPRCISAEDLAAECFAAKRKFYSWKSIALRMLDSDTDWSLFGTGMTGIANLISRREIYNKQARLLGST
ncbi:MAG TPA: cobalamin-dependent protein [Mariprofundaceae bacterium]|nr:cobalamin-dependent protein [Mariprofundaceae bacterium]